MMRKAVFLDRDGIINKEKGFIRRLEDFELLPGIEQALKILQDRGYLLIVVSNQSGIAKNLYTVADVEQIHDFMRCEFEKHGITLSEIYYCIHHPDTSRCLCRKPDSLFLEKAIARFSIDPSKSYFIGDKERDFDAGRKAGVHPIQVEENTPLGLLLELIKE